MQEKKHKRSGRAFFMIALPAICLLLIAAPVLETRYIQSLYQRANGILRTYKTYIEAGQRLGQGSSTCRDRARLFLYSGEKAHAEAYFAVESSETGSAAVDTLLEETGDPCALRESLIPLNERSVVFYETECHAMKLAALSYGMDLAELPGPLGDYPLEAGEERLNSEQKRDEAYALLYSDPFCEERDAVDAERADLFSAAENDLQEQMLTVNTRIERGLRLQHILLGISAGAMVGLILFLRYCRKMDAAEERERIRELEEAKYRAEAEDRTKTAFLLNISHDIRMPMNEVLSFANLAGKHADEPEKVREMLAKIRSSCGHMINIVNDILELNRIENNAVEITEVSADVMRCGEELEMMVGSHAAAKGVEYSVELGHIENRYVYLDIMHTVRLLVNLVSNGIKYTPAGGKVTLAVEQLGAPTDGIARYSFAVRDTGIGMNEWFTQHLFEPFARGNDRNEEIKGVGLGLTITKKLIDSMGGTISVESELGKGSTFTVILPFRVQTPEEIATNYGAGAEERSTDKKGYRTLMNKRVLLADDNELQREIMGEVLSAEGAETFKVADGEAALRLFVEKPEGFFDLILLDSQMTGMSGFDTAVNIRGLDKGCTVPIFALTVMTQEEDRVNALVAGMNGVVEKPINVSELMNKWRISC